MLSSLILWALCFASTRTVAGSPTTTGDRRGDEAKLSAAPGLRKLLQSSGAEARIFGGDDAPPERFPFACSLRGLGTRNHVCGGTLINPEWVLTAAHCFNEDMDLSRTPLVFVGAHGINDGSFAEVIRASEVIIHENWDGNVENGFDIALVRLSRAATRKVPVQMPQSGTVLGDSQLMVAAGWGRTGPRGPLPKVLQFADGVVHVSNENCVTFWPFLRSDMLCSFSRIQGTCQGDSGGPLLLGDASSAGIVADGNPANDLLVGVVSFGSNVCAPIRPDVFTSVGSFRPWIDATMGGSSPTPVAPPRPPAPRPSTPQGPGRCVRGCGPPGGARGITCDFDFGIDYPGNDIISSPLIINNRQECCTRCQNTRGCNGWLWRQSFNHCWLKARLVNPQPCGDCFTMAQ